ncbi:hypothetical protein [Aeromonas sp. MrichA-1]|uniref:hypothetical protein n=1 Tax=Aeromonas sp. MrichA-1 TaxID=2823362 RepID=UPI001B32E70A|nr:hypothetical protein [Aeromonas sp. MrichA-1]MBP4081740.1 hypothetical protein [Aeromonas sp. MrichA-1]
MKMAKGVFYMTSRNATCIEDESRAVDDCPGSSKNVSKMLLGIFLLVMANLTVFICEYTNLIFSSKQTYDLAMQASIILFSLGVYVFIKSGIAILEARNM